MKSVICLGAVALLFSGCASVYAPLITKTHSPINPTKEATFAFALEPDSRVEKQQFCARAKEYFVNAGYRIVEPDTADYRIEFNVLGPRVANVQYEARYIKPAVTAPSSRRTITRRIKVGDERSLFLFVVYPKVDASHGEKQSVWEATVAATQENFRAHEEEFLLRIFAHLGEDFDGELALKKVPKV